MGGRNDRFDIRPGDVFANGRSRVCWSEVVRPDELVEMYPACCGPRPGRRGRRRSNRCGPCATPWCSGTASLLKRAHVGAAHVDTVRASTLARRLAEHVVGHYASIARPPR